MALERDFDADARSVRLRTLFWSGVLSKCGLNHDVDFSFDLMFDFTSGLNSDFDSHLMSDLIYDLIYDLCVCFFMTRCMT